MSVKFIFRAAAVVTAGLLLAGCPIEEIRPTSGGVYYGEADFGPVLGVVSESGEMQLLDPRTGTQYAGLLSSDGGDVIFGAVGAYAGPGIRFCDGFRRSQGTLEGERFPEEYLDAYLDFGCAGVGISLEYSSEYDLGSSFSAIRGDYYAPESDTDLTISRDGIIDLERGDGCFGTGAINLVDARYNTYQVDLLLSCGNRDLEYRGLAVERDLFLSGYDGISLFLTGETDGLYGDFEDR